MQISLHIRFDHDRCSWLFNKSGTCDNRSCTKFGAIVDRRVHLLITLIMNHQTLISQDVIDTAMMTLLKPALKRINEDLVDVLSACSMLIENHRATPMEGRILIQQALLITFEVKIS